MRNGLTTTAAAAIIPGVAYRNFQILAFVLKDAVPVGANDDLPNSDTFKICRILLVS